MAGSPLRRTSFSYGPQILQILPNAGVISGGDTVQIYGYGFGSDPARISVKIGGATAVVQKSRASRLSFLLFGLDASYPFSLERMISRCRPALPAKLTFSFQHRGLRNLS